MKTQKIAKQTWIIIPGFNESKYLDQVLAKVKQYHHRIVFVDDGSSDHSAKIAREHTPHVLVHDLNLGKGAALKTGCEYAFNELDAKYAIFMDADNQHDPQEIELFINKLKDGSQIVFGERGVDHRMPLIRVILNRLASFLVWLFFGRYIPDIPSGYKAISRWAYQRIRWQAADYGVELEIAAKVAKHHLSFDTVKISTIYHEFDRGMSILDTLKLVVYLVSLRLSL